MIFLLRTRRVAASLAPLALVALAGCQDTAPTSAAPAAPAEAPHAHVASLPVGKVAAVKRTTKLTADVTGSLTLMGTGGTLRLPGVGLTVEVPLAALPNPSQPLTITVRAVKGDQLAYEFGPSGTVFRAPIRVSQALSTIKYKSVPAGILGGTPLVGSYFKSTADLDATTGDVASYETLPLTIDLTRGVATIPVTHFSGYTVGWGRTTTIRR